jgi:hypothetical protein
MDGITVPLDRPKVKRSASSQILLREWPKLHRACISTYFESRSFSVVDQDNRSPAGYMLHGAIAAARLYDDRFVHKPLPRETLDQVFAGELWYHFTRNRTFRRPQAALYQALLNLVIERPEKFWKESSR